MATQKDVADRALVDGQGKRVVEPGDFRVLTGSSSRDCDLQTAEFTVIE